MRHIFVLSLILLFAVSCDKNEDKEYVPEHLFRPINFKVDITGNAVKFSWTPIAGATYLLEISEDNLLFENGLRSFSLPAVAEYDVDNLSYGTQYSARIKSVSSNPAIKDSDFQAITFTTQAN